MRAIGLFSAEMFLIWNEKLSPLFANFQIKSFYLATMASLRRGAKDKQSSHR